MAGHNGDATTRLPLPNVRVLCGDSGVPCVGAGEIGQRDTNRIY